MPFHGKYLQPNMCNLKDQVKIPLGSFKFVPYFQSVKKGYILTSTANIDGCRKLTADGGEKSKGRCIFAFEKHSCHSSMGVCG